MRQHLNMKPPPLRERAPGVGESLCRLVHDMLAKEGAKRPSMTQVQERLAMSERSTANRRRYLLLALAMGVLVAGGWFGWHHGKRLAMPAAATQATAGLPAAAPAPGALPVLAGDQPTGTTPAPAAGPAPAAPAPAAAVPPAAGAAVPPAVAAAAAPAAAAAVAPEAAPGVHGGGGASASRASRRRATREAGRHEQPAATPPAAGVGTGGGVLKAIDFGKH